MHITDFLNQTFTDPTQGHSPFGYYNRDGFRTSSSWASSRGINTAQYNNNSIMPYFIYSDYGSDAKGRWTIPLHYPKTTINTAFNFNSSSITNPPDQWLWIVPKDSTNRPAPWEVGIDIPYGLTGNENRQAVLAGTAPTFFNKLYEKVGTSSSYDFFYLSATGLNLEYSTDGTNWYNFNLKYNDRFYYYMGNGSYNIYHTGLIRRVAVIMQAGGGGGASIGASATTGGGGGSAGSLAAFVLDIDKVWRSSTSDPRKYYKFQIQSGGDPDGIGGGQILYFVNEEGVSSHIVFLLGGQPGTTSSGGQSSGQSSFSNRYYDYLWPIGILRPNLGSIQGYINESFFGDSYEFKGNQPGILEGDSGYMYNQGDSGTGTAGIGLVYNTNTMYRASSQALYLYKPWERKGYFTTPSFGKQKLGGPGGRSIFGTGGMCAWSGGEQTITRTDSIPYGAGGCGGVVSSNSSMRAGQRGGKSYFCICY